MHGLGKGEEILKGKSMEINKDISISEWLMGEIRVNLGKKPREHIHLSDLLAPRKAYFQRVLPQYATDEEIMYWTTGRGHEDAILYASGYEHGEVSEWNGIYYTPDLFQSLPVEIKTRRRYLAKEGKEITTYEHYLKQLKGYCAITNKQKGWLWVWCLVSKDDDSGKTKPELVCYSVTFTPEELEAERARLITTRNDLLIALERKDHSILPACPSWMCGKELRTMVKKPFCTTCKKEFETEWGMERHLSSKTGNGHKMNKPEYEVNYQKSCKWFDDCLQKELK